MTGLSLSETVAFTRCFIARGLFVRGDETEGWRRGVVPGALVIMNVWTGGVSVWRLALFGEVLHRGGGSLLPGYRAILYRRALLNKL